MPRKRKYKAKQLHYCLLVNKSAARYRVQPVKKLISAIRRQNAKYTVLEPPDAVGLLNAARSAAGLKRASDSLRRDIERRGAFTALIACGGDGTFNLVARAGMQTSLPIGILPMGRFDNIARALYGGGGIDTAIERLVSKNYRKLDIGRVADQVFFGSIGLGFWPAMFGLLNQRKSPRFGIGWSRLAGAAATSVEPVTRVIKVDTFRFETASRMLNVSVLPYFCGLPVTDASLPDDGRAEVIFDVDADQSDISGFVRDVYKKRQLFGKTFRLYRGQVIVIQPTRGDQLYIDGELIELPTNTLDITIEKRRLNVIC